MISPLNAGGEDDAKKLQGEWDIVVAKVGDRGHEPDGAQMIFKGDKVTFKAKTEENTAKFSLDTKKKPRHLSTLIEDGKAKGEARLAIYEFTGDTLKIRWGRGDKRPKDFKTDDGENFIYMELKRVKK
jgi:uncharacterized protein (TIGR03067 family)